MISSPSIRKLKSIKIFGIKYFTLCITLSLIQFLLSGCSKDPSSELPEPGLYQQPWPSTCLLPDQGIATDWNLLLITLDTTRSDRLGCYGCPNSCSPRIDQLAKRGIVFKHATTPVPITLPAHSTLMTGLNPYEHGVRSNGNYQLAEEYITLAEIFSEQGFSTSATIGAVPLQIGFGLEQGFDLYDDDFAMKSRGLDGGVIERPADEVTSLALASIAENSNRPFFHWAHYYDPHIPYTPPETFRERFTNPYDGEVAFMDSEVGRLIDGLADLDLMANTWILIVADHGESIGDHGEPSHGMLIYGPTQHVPCILIPPTDWETRAGIEIRNRTIKEIISLRDLAPTLVHAFGLPASALPASGLTLLPLICEMWSGPQVTYMETLMPALDYGWSDLRGVRTSRWSYIRAPEMELYDIQSDPGELNNLYYRYPNVVERLDKWLTFFLQNEAEPRASNQPDLATIEQLRSLGYLGGVAPSIPDQPSEKDPKKLMQLVTEISEAYLKIALNPTAAKTELEGALQQDPDNRVAKRFLAKALIRLQLWSQAEQILRSLFEIFPQDPEIMFDWGKSLMMLDSLSIAEPLILGATENRLDQPDMSGLYAEFIARSGRLDEARSLLYRIIIDQPEQIQPIICLARLEMAQGNIDETERLARMAIDTNPEMADGYAILAEMLWVNIGRRQSASRDIEGSINEIKPHLEKALSLDPNEPMAAFRLATILLRENQPQQACELFQRALLRAPQLVEAHVRLGNMFLETGQAEPARTHLGAARELGANSLGIVLSYGVACSMLGLTAEARDSFEQALLMNPDPTTAENIRQQLEQL